MPTDALNFTLDDARRILDDVFAPWIKDLALTVEDIAPTPQGEPGAILRMPFSSRLCRDNGVVCGQALMAFADTAMVIAMVTANSGYRPMTGRVTLTSATDGKPVAMVSSAFAML